MVFIYFILQGYLGQSVSDPAFETSFCFVHANVNCTTWM